MKALKVFKPNDMQLIDMDMPSITSDTHVLVKVTASGICGSDIHILGGTHAHVQYPRVIGHEGAGVVEKIGAAVTDLKVGDSVVIDSYLSCGKCYACKKGRQNCCSSVSVFGSHMDGTFREYMVLERKQLFKYPASLTPVQAATTEPYSIGTQANSRGGTTKGDLVLIHGAGPIGSIVCDVAETLGATCIVSEVNERRLAMAKHFGAKYFLNPEKDDISKRVMEISDGMGVNIIFDAAGAQNVAEESIHMLSVAGTLVPIATHGAKPKLINFPRLNKNELTIAATRLHCNKFSEVVASLPGRVDRINHLVTHVFTIDEYKDAFIAASDKESGACKVIIKF